MLLIKLVNLVSLQAQWDLNDAGMLHLYFRIKSLLRSLGRSEGCEFEKGSGEQNHIKLGLLQAGWAGREIGSLF